MNYKRRKCRRQVRCNICTPYRVGNGQPQVGNRPGHESQSKSLRNEEGKCFIGRVEKDIALTD